MQRRFQKGPRIAAASEIPGMEPRVIHQGPSNPGANGIAVTVRQWAGKETVRCQTLNNGVREAVVPPEGVPTASANTEACL